MILSSQPNPYNLPNSTFRRIFNGRQLLLLIKHDEFSNFLNIQIKYIQKIQELEFLL